MIARVFGFGVTVMLAKAPVVTTTVAVPEIGPTLATRVFVKVPETVPAVNMPVVFVLPPPAATDQLGSTEMTFPATSFTMAVNCCAPPVASVF